MDSSKVIFLDYYQTLVDVPLDMKEGEQRGWEEFVRVLHQTHGIQTTVSNFLELLGKRRADFYADKDKTIHHHNLHTLVSDVLEKDLGAVLSKDEIDFLIYEHRKISRGHLRLYPHVAETLAVLAEKYTLSIASYAHSCVTQLELRELGIEKYFSYFMYTSDIGFKKKSPEFYRECLRLVGKDPHDCVMVGDNYSNDIEVPSTLGMHTIWIKNPVTLSEESALAGEPKHFLALENFAALPGVIAHIFES